MPSRFLSVSNQTKQYLVGRVREVSRLNGGKSRIVFDAKVGAPSIIRTITVELELSRVDPSRLQGSKLIMTADVQRADDQLHAVNIESYGIEYRPIAA